MNLRKRRLAGLLLACTLLLGLLPAAALAADLGDLQNVTLSDGVLSWDPFRSYDTYQLRVRTPDGIETDWGLAFAAFSPGEQFSIDVRSDLADANYRPGLYHLRLAASTDFTDRSNPWEADYYYPGPRPELSFADVPDDAYCHDAVLWAAAGGITGGTDETHFSPNAPCTRAQAVTFLWRAAGSPAPEAGAPAFADVPDDAYYRDAVLWAAANGVTGGTDAAHFSPNAPCTRAQIVTLLWRADSAPNGAAANPFTDVPNDAYYAAPVLWAVANGVTTGTGADVFSPDAPCTRGQIVTFLYRCRAD